LEGNPPFYLNQLASSFCEKRILTDARKLPKPWGTESLAGVEEIWKGKWSKKFLSVKGDERALSPGWAPEECPDLIGRRFQ
jgi:hypothetical protein